MVTDGLHILVEKGQPLQGFPVVQSYLHLIKTGGYIGGEHKLVPIQNQLTRPPVVCGPWYNPGGPSVRLRNYGSVWGD
jgi:hypothetical protein